MDFLREHQILHFALKFGQFFKGLNCNKAIGLLHAGMTLVENEYKRNK